MSGPRVYESNDFDRDIANGNKAIELNPTSVSAYNNRGLAYWAKGMLDEAIADYDTTIRLNPSYIVAHNNRGLAYQAKGDMEKAFADYARSIEIDPHHPVAYRLRGFANFDLGKFDTAAADFASAVQQEPAGARQAFWLYLARTRAGAKGDPAAELRLNATRLNQTEWPYPVVELFLGNRDPEATLAAAQGVKERCEAQFYVGEWYVLRRDRAAAINALNAALKACPTHLIENAGAQAELKRLDQ